MRRSKLAMGAVLGLSAAVLGVVGIAPAAHAQKPDGGRSCGGWVKEYDEHLNFTGHMWIQCDGVWARY